MWHCQAKDKIDALNFEYLNITKVMKCLGYSLCSCFLALASAAFDPLRLGGWQWVVGVRRRVWRLSASAEVLPSRSDDANYWSPDQINKRKAPTERPIGAKQIEDTSVPAQTQ
jgi:hypothetical protein